MSRPGPVDHLSVEDLLEIASGILGTDLRLPVDDAERLVVGVAAGEIDVPDLAKALALTS
ncbi:MAG TPA: hypothetical protein VI357_00200 [Mycobacteriales bacterium]